MLGNKFSGQVEGLSQLRESVAESQSCLIRSENNISKFVYSCLNPLFPTNMNGSTMIHLDLVSFHMTTRENSTPFPWYAIWEIMMTMAKQWWFCTSAAIGKLLSWWALSIPLTLENLSSVFRRWTSCPVIPKFELSSTRVAVLMEKWRDTLYLVQWLHGLHIY